MSELHYLTIRQAADLIRDHKLSPVELTRAFLDRIAALNGKLNAYITVAGESALAEARTAEAEILRGDQRGPLHGIPIALKDLYATKGLLTTAHSRLLMEWVPEEDSTAAAKLREAGAVLLGKLAMHEYAFGAPHFNGPFPPARNPWDTERIPGGSSSGSGTAVAAGLCMGSLGSDTGGSIRGPASFCGIVGLKPTYGRVSRYGVVPLSWTLDHCGPMTWTVEDTVLMLQAIAGHDARDPASSRAPVPDYSSALLEDVRGLVIGVPRHYFFKPEEVHAETLAAVDAAIAVLKGRGAEVREVEIPSLKHAGATSRVILTAEAYAYHEANVKARPQDYGEVLRDRITLGGLYSAADYIQALRWRAVIQQEVSQALMEVDVLATPTSAQPAGRFEESASLMNTLRRPGFTGPFNLTGLPAISVCCGFNSDGLPIGLQIAGRPFDEATVLRVGHTYEKATPWREKRPPV
ncbi:MAG: Asp-tRNA(Asn)/Glu-tRNA(Gln) amidotransferase subunit GatA [Chloroflexi bacterium]|nr:Asp-tRNA(Asn)/Glu-tRNA(Gln) amidotransferase subunit GatA [Chloroflexota bacterium]